MKLLRTLCGAIPTYVLALLLVALFGYAYALDRISDVSRCGFTAKTYGFPVNCPRTFWHRFL
ncbi:hypothetical protein SAMN05216345_101738 [Cupriavidus sp. YR651]|nr:hypothetical protein SAMN05216345_101738 [Cupriavidus sp. YR651]